VGTLIFADFSEDVRESEELRASPNRRSADAFEIVLIPLAEFSVD
jgi:hypothetical protein